MRIRTLSLVGMLFMVACPEQTAQPVDMSSQPDAQVNTWVSNLFCEHAAIDEYIKNKHIDVDVGKELIIREPNVVDDFCRTTGLDEQAAALRGCKPETVGKWNLWYLMSQAAGAVPIDEFLRRWVQTWAPPPSVMGVPIPITVNGHALPVRNKAALFISTTWTQNYQRQTAPFRLLAIVNRIDLAGLTTSQYVGAPFGELRMVYGILDEQGNPLQATISLEYRYPIATQKSALEWAQQWRDLAQKSASDEDYRTALQAITDAVVKNYSDEPGRPNRRSALLRVRTNEQAFSSTGTWDMREFAFAPDSAVTCLDQDRLNCNLLKPGQLPNTPDKAYNNTLILRDWILINQEKILTQTHDVPTSYIYAGKSEPLLTGSIEGFPPDSLWEFSGAAEKYEIRHLFGYATCNGCHYVETDTKNLHIRPRTESMRSDVSPFLDWSKGLRTPMAHFTNEPYTGKKRYFNEPRRRACEYVRILSGTEARYRPLNNSTLSD